MNELQKIQFNHFYKLHHDLKRTYILGRKEINEFQKDFVNIQWISKIHPVFAMIFSLLSEPIEKSEAIKEISYFLDITDTESTELISKFLDSTEPFIIEYKGIKSFFPMNIIVHESNADSCLHIYSPDEFTYKDVELEQERFYKAPLGIVFMVNNTCATDCIYCYADKQTKSSIMPFQKVIDLITESKELNVQSFTIVGGEFFLYEQWDNMLDILVKFNYKPELISTKVPINEEIILKYKKYDLPIQISLDSLDENKLVSILGVGRKYSENIKKTILLLDKHNIKFQISTVLTSYNDDIENLDQLFTFLSKLKNLTRWEIRVGFKSLYSKSQFDTIKIKTEEVKKIDEWVRDKIKISDMYILWSPNDINKYFKTEGGSRNFIGSRCSANYSHMIILPDGQVTICEQLYWNPRFLIGDVRKSTISEIWNSPKALSLAFLQRKDFRDESVCSKCEIFENCMTFPNRCIADILKGYGDENWDFPDPRCNKAPQFIHKLT
jgi:radical SAM protein with 4Fe4S-binding SPASM domain